MSRETVLDNAKKLYTTKNEVVRAFESGVFPYKMDSEQNQNQNEALWKKQN